MFYVGQRLKYTCMKVGAFERLGETCFLARRLNSRLNSGVKVNNAKSCFLSVIFK